MRLWITLLLVLPPAVVARRTLSAEPFMITSCR
jgi:hypothetical protein